MCELMVAEHIIREAPHLRIRSQVRNEYNTFIHEKVNRTNTEKPCDTCLFWSVP